MTWADVKAHIVVKPVASPIASDPLEMHETSLMLMECDNGAQRSFFRTFEFDRFGDKQFGPPLVKSDSFDLISRISEAVPASEIQGMGDIVRKASTGVRRHGMRATVLSKMGSAKEEAMSRVLWCQDRD